MLLVKSVLTVKFSFDCKVHFLQLSSEWTVLTASVGAAVARLMRFTSNTFWWCILHHLLHMILGSHFRLTLSVLSCFSVVAVHLIGAAPTTEPSIKAEQYPRRHFQRPQIFFPASDSHTSITILHVQPNDAEVDKAMPKRLYTRCITLLLCIHVDPSGILCYGTTIRSFG